MTIATPLRRALAAVSVAGALLGARSSSAVAQPDSARRAAAGYTAGDVRFMQGMIGHHAQAIAMASLIASHTATPAMALLGERITVSQRDEIGLMRHWLASRRERVPATDTTFRAALAAARAMTSAHDMPNMPDMPDMPDMPEMSAVPGSSRMPGMLDAAELAALDSARGTAFDRRFLRDMIRHHQGALAMVKTLLASPGAGQEVETFRFAADVDADQRAEIDRMRVLLTSLPAAP